MCHGGTVSVKLQQKNIKECSIPTLRKRNNIENLINLKKAKAVTRRAILASQKKAQKNYVSTNTTNTPKQIWDKTRKMKGKQSPSQTASLLIGNKIITKPQDIFPATSTTLMH